MAAGSASVVGARPRATVIGAGIVGVCCASYLQREGFEVEIVDFADPGTQCSFGNAGGILSRLLRADRHAGHAEEGAGMAR